MKTLKLFLFFIFCTSLTGLAQERILLSKAKIHIGNGKVINQGLVGIEGEDIILVENALTYQVNSSEWDTIIELRGQELYPGFIAPNSTLGLVEIDAVRATRDFYEVGTFNPHIRALIAFNAESEVSAVTKTNGVLYSQATPQGGVISGASSIMKLEGWNWEDAVIKVDDGIHLHWPSATSGGGWWPDAPAKKNNKNYSEQVKRINDFFSIATAYTQTKEEFDQRYEAMRGVFSGKKNLYVHANDIRAIVDVIDFKRDFKIENVVIVGGYEAYRVTDQLLDAQIPIILKGGHTLPENEDDPVDLFYRLPFLLQEAGVLFCIQNSGAIEIMNFRNLPFYAGTAMAYGLTEEEAISAVTLNTAKILGIDDIAGSIEVGKKATLFVSKGNALDMRTNDMTLGMIYGEFIELSNRQTRLYEKYKNKP